MEVVQKHIGLSLHKKRVPILASHAPEIEVNVLLLLHRFCSCYFPFLAQFEALPHFIA